jgi:putative toxin-antitoxin system antitoxin component (TIGR02293 family)
LIYRNYQFIWVHGHRQERMAAIVDNWPPGIYDDAVWRLRFGGTKMVATSRNQSGRQRRGPRAAPAKLPAGSVDGNRYLSILGLAALDTSKLIAKIQEGLPYRAWELFAQATGLPREVAARVMQIPLRTLARRKEEGRLHADESDRLVRIARLFAQALGLFNGEVEPTRAWLMSPQMALGGETPLDYAGTEVGAREVDSLIGRLEHGIPS